MATASLVPAVDNGELEDDVDVNIDMASNNPMLNTLVLQRMFQYCGLMELKTCRQVCRIWKTLARPTIQNLSKVKFMGSVEDLRDFEALVSTSEYLPSSNFQFKTINEDIIRFCNVFAEDITSISLLLICNLLPELTENGSSLMNNFHQLLTTGVLSRLKELTIMSQISQRIPRSPRPVVSNLLSGVTFPNVKKLSVSKFSDENMLALMKATPNLESVQIWNSDCDFLLSSMERISSTSRSKIRRITVFNGILNDVRLQRLLDLNLNLTHLDLGHVTDKVEEEIAPLLAALLQQLLNQQRKTLKMFYLPQVRVYGNKNKRYIIHLPCMELLEELYVGYQIVCIVASFKMDLPVLKKYNCAFNINGSCSIQPADRVPCLTVTHLVNIPSEPLSDNAFVKLHEQFPNVSHLELRVRENGSVRSIWALWPGLEVLKIQLGLDYPHSPFND